MLIKFYWYKTTEWSFYFMKKLGKQTIKFDNPPTILECATIVGPKESEGPIAR